VLGEEERACVEDREPSEEHRVLWHKKAAVEEMHGALEKTLKLIEKAENEDEWAYCTDDIKEIVGKALDFAAAPIAKEN
jgi:hypothetical protein